VVPKANSTISSEQVLKLLEGRIARFKHPKEVVLVKALPKTALGKIRKEEVRHMVAQSA
jgi:fatty-acyl-CoA synthase